eukprot:1173979-Pyramimonas_sp.AAC.1
MRHTRSTSVFALPSDRLHAPCICPRREAAHLEQRCQQCFGFGRVSRRWQRSEVAHIVVSMGMHGGSHHTPLHRAPFPSSRVRAAGRNDPLRQLGSGPRARPDLARGQVGEAEASQRGGLSLVAFS